MSPRPRAALLVAGAALLALVAPLPLAAAALALVAVLVGADALAVRRPPEVARTLPALLSRGVPAPLRLELAAPAPGGVRLRQPLVPDLVVEPAEADGRLDAVMIAGRRGRRLLPAPAARLDGPLGLVSWYHRAGEEVEVPVYPDLPAAFRLALAVRRGTFAAEARRTLGPLGLGTEFESVRDYLPDDDVRHVNWRATARLGRPMSNQYRLERDRDLICLVDTGRLMAAPLGDRTRLDAALDAVAAVAAVADEVGDRCGLLAFDTEIRRLVLPRRKGARPVLHAAFDLEPRAVDSDYELAFRTLRGAKRAFALVLTDLLEEAAARPLVEAVPLLARGHAVAVASAADTDLQAMVEREPEAAVDVYAAAVALDVLAARERVAAHLRAAGARVVEAAPSALSAACVAAYLRAKARALL